MELPKNLICMGWCAICGVTEPIFCHFRVILMKRLGNSCNIELLSSRTGVTLASITVFLSLIKMASCYLSFAKDMGLTGEEKSVNSGHGDETV